MGAKPGFRTATQGGSFDGSPHPRPRQGPDPTLRHTPVGSLLPPMDRHRPTTPPGSPRTTHRRGRRTARPPTAPRLLRRQRLPSLPPCAHAPDRPLPTRLRCPPARTLGPELPLPRRTEVARLRYPPLPLPPVPLPGTPGEFARRLAPPSHRSGGRPRHHHRDPRGVGRLDPRGPRLAAPHAQPQDVGPALGRAGAGGGGRWPGCR